MESCFKNSSIDVVYHTAAYKHVPMIEHNIIPGIENNIFGTHTLAKVSAKFGVEKFVLVSTDKAVRPTNIMGATKRFAELICQSLFDRYETKFCIVRFGNVLGSSGSVIPKFKAQIQQGGPVTVTHPEITRYFMSIPEASNLVLVAGAIADGGEVFLLDMGQPVKILDLAKSMIRQHGLFPTLSLADTDENLKDDTILIEFTGLRDGEKLFEELLIDAEAEATEHKRIFRANEHKLQPDELIGYLNTLESMIGDENIHQIKSFLQSVPIGYSPSTNCENQKKLISTDLLINDSNKTQAEISHHSMNLLSRNNSFLSKFLSKTLHQYFWLTRGMTLGVRVAVFNERGKVLLVKHTYAAGWHFPGGGVDHHEVNL